MPVVILSLFILTGCEKDFLKITPTDRISEEALKSDSSLFKAFVINRYMTVRLHDKESEGSRPGFAVVLNMQSGLQLLMRGCIQMTISHG